MSTSSKRKILIKKVATTVNIGCGCRRSKLSSIFSPKPKSKLPKYQNHFNLSNSSSSSTSQTTTTSAFSPYVDYYTNSNTTTYTNTAYSSSPQPAATVIDGFGRRVGAGKSVAVEKDSDDPYLDFRQSMLQMIVENGIYSKDELKEMLNCFLQLNSPSLHGIIIRAFTEIWNSIYFNSERGGRKRRSSAYDSPKVHVWPKSYEI